MLVVWLFLAGIAAASNEQAWYSSRTKPAVSLDPGVFAAKTAIDLCTLPPDIGGCTKELVRYYYDPVTDDCKRFLFTGCGGNSNRFMRRTHCRSRCVKNRIKIQSLHEIQEGEEDHKDAKHRRTLTTTTVPTTSTTMSTTEAPKRTEPVTPDLKPVEKVPIPSAIKQCPHCDPLFGVCIDGECGCIAGFKKLGRICIDINECDKGDSVCPANSRCTNTIGSFRCDCEAGFDENGECKIEEDACRDRFDIMLTEEDCNHGEQSIRYYFDHETASCRQFFYGGCKSTSRNIFNDIQTCNTLCMGKNIQPRDPEPTIPVKLKLDLEPKTTPAMTIEEKKEEVTKIIKIMHHINPNENPCSHPFDEDLREECVLAHWEERFFWNSLVRECEPFWYDATCSPSRTSGKNFFDNLKSCQSRCGEELGTAQDELPASTTQIPSTVFIPVMTTLNDPYNLIYHHIPSAAPTTMIPEPNTPTFIQETGNFAPKSAVTKFDKQKYIEEFKRKLNSLPDDYTKKSDPFDPVTKKPLFTLFTQEEKTHDQSLDTTLFKEVNPIPTTMPQPHDLASKDPLDLSQFVTKRPPFTLNPSIFGEIVDTSPKKAQEITTRSSSGETTTHDPLDLSKFSTKKPPFVLYIAEIQQQPITTAVQSHSSPTDQAQVEHDPLDLSKFVTKRPPFTLNPALFNGLDQTETTATSSRITFEKIHHEQDLNRHRYEVFSPGKENEQNIVHINIEPLIPQQTIITKTPVHDISEKEKISNLLDEMNKPVDLCEEPLHPSLEEDCSGENWVLQYYFNSDKGTCKTFWYGGCPTVARNFFKTHTACKLACAHKIPPPAGGFNPMYVVKPETTTTSTTRRPTTTEGPAIERSFSDIRKLGGEVMIPIKSGEIDETKEKKLRYITTTTLESVTVPIVETTPRTGGDPCDDGYDEEWDSDCSGDNWEVRSYYDVKTNSCKRFWWGGCSTPNRNIWKDKQVCITECGHKMKQEEDGQLATDAPVYGSAEPPSNMIHVFELPTASALVGDRSLSDPDPTKPTSRKSRKNRQKLNLKWNIVKTTYEIEKAPSSGGFWGIQNDAPVSSSEEEKPSYATKEHFQVDLQRKLANKKRMHEGRADLAYSSAVGHPVTIASECLEPFDTDLSQTCKNGSKWTNRYYFDPDIRACRMYWNDGCSSYSKNNFPDMETCQWKCEGRHPEPERAKSCLEPFDQFYLEDCRHGEFGNRFFFDFEKKRCTAFHWGGCRSESKNFFIDLGDCQEICETPPRHLTQSCIEPFDESYKDSCSADGRYLQYYYFDHSTHTCKMFWYGNCKGEAQNIYPTLETCQWICERHREERAPSYCLDQFDTKYTESCGDGRWMEKWYFEHNTGECLSFWWDGCISPSQNIFPDEKTCKLHCVSPGHIIESKLPDPDTKFRCLEPVEIGTCRETYPAFYYDRNSKTCKAFAYSGCGGNGNRFMTISQCEGLCSAFEDMSAPEMDCHLPLHVGFGQNDHQCLETAGYRYYYDRDYGRCTQFWYMGCGGNANSFYSYDVCMRTCRVERRRLERKPRASSTACYKASGVSNKCPSKISRPVQRWTYNNMKCVSFSYNGCGGNENRFSTEVDCKNTCGTNKPSADASVCSFESDVGPCNQLRYKWFYNQTRGTCDQFLYGGCEGNTNRFDNFEECQKRCEISGIDPCLESLDRGNWCEAMSNRYYFNKKSKQCRGFHYTGCGKSGNNFFTLEECHTKCELRYPKKRAAPPKAAAKKKVAVNKLGYSGVKPPEKTAMIRHIELNGVNRTYYKSELEWIDYGLCLGYRYNVSGRDTVLQVHLCSHQGDAVCYSDSFVSTNGEEFCQILRPFLRGTSLYTWYFALDLKHKSAIGDDKSRQVQRDYETTANVLQLKANHCHDIC